MLNRHCPEGKPFRPRHERAGLLGGLIGSCEACGIGPLHRAGPYGSRCTCSFFRTAQPRSLRASWEGTIKDGELTGVLLCRRCALAYDLVTKGTTRLPDLISVQQLWQTFNELYKLGTQAKERADERSNSDRTD